MSQRKRKKKNNKKEVGGKKKKKNFFFSLLPSPLLAPFHPCFMHANQWQGASNNNK
jgi:hypothetical protein